MDDAVRARLAAALPDRWFIFALGRHHLTLKPGFYAVVANRDTHQTAKGEGYTRIAAVKAAVKRATQRQAENDAAVSGLLDRVFSGPRTTREGGDHER